MKHYTRCQTQLPENNSQVLLMRKVHAHFRSAGAAQYEGRDRVADEFELQQNNNMSEVIDTLRSNLNSWGELAEVILFLNYFLGRELKEENELMEGRVQRIKEIRTEAIHRPNK